MAVNWMGVISMAVFYMAVLGMGIWASRKSKREEKKCKGNLSEITMVGGRNLSLWVSVFTMTATWVGGGYIMYSAEVVYDPTRGLIWDTGLVALSLTMIIGGLFIVTPMRSKNYVTLMDPFQEKYGCTITAVLFIPALLADVLWVASILGLLGGTLSVVMEISSVAAIAVSAAVAIIYTLMGGLYSVAYTDVIQLCFVFFGLWSCVPFILTSPSAANFTVAAITKVHQEPWIGKLELEDAGRWVDELLLIGIGGICYQAFHQRILSTASDRHAKITCFVGAVLCPILGIPSAIVGAVAASADWNQTTVGSTSPYEQGKAPMILPIALQHLCPYAVSVIAMGALAAAVMSSVDSALLSCASQLGRNIYKNVIYKKASERSIVVMVRVSTFLCGVVGAALAMTSSSISLFWIMSSDVLYCMMSPQVICVLFLPQRVNEYGACVGFALALLLRLLVGQPEMGLPDLLPLPWDKTQQNGQRLRQFPYCTVIMLFTLVIILVVSSLATWLSKYRARNANTDPSNGQPLEHICRDKAESEPLATNC